MIWVDAAGVTHDQNIADVDDLQGMMGISDIRDDVNAIEAMIPGQASQANQLADKTFVNSSIATATAEFMGSLNLVTHLHLDPDTATHTDIADELDDYSFVGTPDNNDYCFVEWPEDTTHTSQITQVERYKFNGSNWAYEYTLNNSGMTAAQLAATLSGITDVKVAKLDALPDNATLTATLAGKVDTVTGKGLSTNDFTTPEKTKLASAIVGATSGTNPVVSTVKVMTSAEYYALTSLDANTEYIII